MTRALLVLLLAGCRGPLADGETCFENAACDGQRCVQTGRNLTEGYCTRACEKDAGQCASGFACSGGSGSGVLTSGGASVCLPLCGHCPLGTDCTDAGFCRGRL